MTSTWAKIASLPAVILACLLLAAAPATQQTDSENSLATNQVQFKLLAEGWKRYPAKNPDSAYFQNTKGDSAIQLIWAPKEFQFTPDTIGNFAGAIIKQLKSQHVDQKTVMVMPPKIIKDRRFDIYIEEKFKVGEVTEDELHIYKSVGPRVLMATVSCVSSDPATIAATHKVGEDLVVSCKFNRKAFKKSP